MRDVKRENVCYLPEEPAVWSTQRKAKLPEEVGGPNAWRAEEGRKGERGRRRESGTKRAEDTRPLAMRLHSLQTEKKRKKKGGTWNKGRWHQTTKWEWTLYLLHETSKFGGYFLMVLPPLVPHIPMVIDCFIPFPIFLLVQAFLFLYPCYSVLSLKTKKLSKCQKNSGFGSPCNNSLSCLFWLIHLFRFKYSQSTSQPPT